MAYRASKKVKEWKDFKKMVKNTKWLFFNDKIQKIASKNHKL